MEKYDYYLVRYKDYQEKTQQGVLYAPSTITLEEVQEKFPNIEEMFWISGYGFEFNR